MISTRWHQTRRFWCRRVRNTKSKRHQTERENITHTATQVRKYTKTLIRIFSFSDRARKRAKHAMMMPISIALINVARACGPRNATPRSPTSGIVVESSWCIGKLPSSSPTATNRLRSGDRGRSSISGRGKGSWERALHFEEKKIRKMGTRRG